MQYDQLGKEIGALFDSFAMSLTNVYLSYRLSGKPGSGPRVQAQTDVGFLANSFLQAANNAAQVYLTNINIGTLLDPTVDPRATALIRSLHVIANESTSALLRKVNGVGDIKNMLLGQGGAMGQLLRQSVDSVSYVSRDSSGRQWKSAALVRVIARDFAYQAHIDRQVIKLSKDGDLAQIAYTDPKHIHNKLVVSLSGAPGHPSFASIRSIIFHPNAQAQLTDVRT